MRREYTYYMRAYNILYCIWAIPYVAHLTFTKEASFMPVAQTMSIRLLISLIPEELLCIKFYKKNSRNPSIR